MQSKDLKLLVDEVRHAVYVASLNFDIWWVFKGKDTRPKFTRTMNHYTLFFQTGIHAHFVAMLVALYRLYEKRPDTYNIPSLLRKVETSGAISKAVLDEVTKTYALAKPLWIKVSILRNEAFGHRTVKGTVEQAFKKAGISANELRDLIGHTKKLINTISHAADRSVHAFNLDATETTVRLLEDLRAYGEIAREATAL